MIIFLIILLFFQSFIPSYGINEFTTNQEISYQFNQQGISQVEHKINIKNNFSQFYPTEYNLSLSGSQATNIQVFDSNDAIPVNITKNNDEIKLSLKLTNSKTGKDQITPLTIRYQSNSLAKKKGKTWEINLPQFQDNLNNNTNISLKIPASFGKLSSSPSGATISIDPQNTNIIFKKYLSKIILTFGEYQLFNFNLKYHIENPLTQNGIFTIPLPPDTANQKIFFTNIHPSPQKIETDLDGNWLAYYQLAPQSNIDIIATGQAKIGQNPNYQFYSQPIFDHQLYWPINNPEIIKLAKLYTTPRQIYDYVVDTLNYDYNRINNSIRHGALTALENPSTSLCTDFTDLFISIARSGGIGAREIEGYAYSNNTDVKPLSVGADILHAWPEYYDNKTKKWIAIDPTWAKTTGGINYFDDLDLNHFTFVIHNQQSDSPAVAGSYKTDPNQKSVDISFADSETTITPIPLIITTKFNPFSQSYVIIKNPNLFSFQNIVPLGEIKINFPQISFFSSLLPQNQKLKITETIIIQNPYHFFNLLLLIVSSLIILSLGAIILLRRK